MASIREQTAPEPWRTDTSDSHYLVTDAQGETIAQIVWNAPGNGRANAERIAVCVTALAGIPTEALRQGVVTDVLAALQALIAVLPKANRASEVFAEFTRGACALAKARGDVQDG